MSRINTRIYGKKAELALGLWVKLARASASFGKLTAEHIHSFGLTVPQFSVLECLGHLGPLPLGEISRKQLVTSGNVTCVIDHLEKDGLVQRIHDEDDRRVVIARLTPKGQKLFDKIFKQHAEFVASISSVLSDDEQQQLGELLKKFGRALHDRYANHAE